MSDASSLFRFRKCETCVFASGIHPSAKAPIGVPLGQAVLHPQVRTCQRYPKHEEVPERYHGCGEHRFDNEKLCAERPDKGWCLLPRGHQGDHDYGRGKA